MKRITRLSLLPLSGLALVLALPAVSTAQNGGTFRPGDAFNADPMDWPNWRGPELNGVSREKGLVDKWSPKGKGENLLWKREDLGGRSTPICMRGKLYTIVRDQPDTEIEGEKVVCLDAATGKTLWENVFNVFLSDVPAPRVGWSSVVGDPATGNVFAMGVCGLFQCINGETGKTIWSHSLGEEHGVISAFGGRAAFPVISGHLVFVSSVYVDWGTKAQPAQRILAFDRRNGQPVWFEDTRPRPEDVSFSTPVPTVIGGNKQLVTASGDGAMYGFQTRTGLNLWSYKASARGMQATPLVVGSHVFLGQAEENRDDRSMGAFFDVDATKHGDVTKSGEIWRKKEIQVDKSCAIPVGDKIVVIDQGGYLLVFNPKNGEIVARRKLDTAVPASPIYADGKVYICTQSGIWYTLAIEDHGVKVVHRERLQGGETNASPIVSHGRIYLQQANVLYCIGQPNHEPHADPRPEPPKEAVADADPTPNLLQIAPCEALLRPEERLQFQARLYNSRGRYLRNARPEEVKFSVEGAGTFDSNGEYTAPATAKPAAVMVKAEFGSLKGGARIRVIPDLNWKFDFNDGQIPITWVGARYRHIPIDYDLLKKVEAKNPLAAQLYIALMTSFVNSGRPALKYDNNTAQQTWTELLRFLNLVEKASTPETAKAQLDPLLKILADEKVVAKWGWPNKQGIELTVARGPRKIDGNGVMLKITTIPRGARSKSLFGQTDLHDYTIQADVCGARKHGRLPDIGIIGQRYSLLLMGDAQQLQVQTWPAHDSRFKRGVANAWKNDTWYTMKFQASNEGAKVVLRGKVWPKGEKEPAKWLIEAADPSPHPNVEGSPGVEGDAKNAEIYYDNILVTKNAK